MATPAAQLEHELVTHPDRVLVVAGIGVSVAASDSHPCASWKGLLQNGLQRCAENCGTAETTLKPYREILADSKAPAHSLISVGQFITDELTGKRQGIYGAWLSDSIGAIKAADAKLVRALVSLGARVATTNYDSIVEEITGRSPITWRDKGLSSHFFRESTNDVLHLHGYYRQPDSVVLGARSYEEICRDRFLQDALRGLMIFGTIVFVGCGTGLEDPNFGVLLHWARDILAQCPHSHFILVRADEVDNWRQRLNGVPVEPIAYGAEHAELVSFVEGLAERVQEKRVDKPYSMLVASQNDFEGRWEELDRDREKIAALDYMQRSEVLATELWQAGGRRRAALAFSSRLNSQRQYLAASEYIEFALATAEWLLNDNLTSQATSHLNEIEKRAGEAGISDTQQRQLEHLRVRCMDAMCAYSESLRAIKEAIPNATDQERARLEAERCEIHFLQGNLGQAAADTD